MSVKIEEAKPIDLLGIVLLAIGLIPWVAMLAMFVPPSTFVLLQWLGIGMPFILTFNTMVLVWCLCMRRWNYYILGIYLVGIGIQIPAMVQWSPTKTRTEVDLKMASYNVRDLRSDYGFSTLDNIVDFAADNNLDVLFLQEVPRDYSAEELLSFFAEMRYVVVSRDDKTGSDRLVILSKYPLTLTYILGEEESVPYSLFADMEVDGRTMTLVNSHLHTTNWNQIDKKWSGSSFLEGSISTISENYEKRAYQTMKIRAMMDSTALPLIAVGDFNDPPVSFSYHTIGKGLKDSFRTAGNGYGYTYRHLKKLFRIDYIFYDGDCFDAYNYRTEDLDYSDHLPVLVDLVFREKR